MADDEDEMVIVCVREDGREHSFADDVVGKCDECGWAIHWRPHNPPGKHICLQCLGDYLASHEEVIMDKPSEQTLAEVRGMLSKMKN